MKLVVSERAIRLYSILAIVGFIIIVLSLITNIYLYSKLSENIDYADNSNSITDLKDDVNSIENKVNSIEYNQSEIQKTIDNIYSDVSDLR